MRSELQIKKKERNKTAYKFEDEGKFVSDSEEQIQETEDKAHLTSKNKKKKSTMFQFEDNGSDQQLEDSPEK